MSDTTESPLSRLLGAGQPTGCRVLAEDISVHWYPQEARAGDPCFCGSRQMQPLDDDTDSGSTPDSADGEATT